MLPAMHLRALVAVISAAVATGAAARPGRVVRVVRGHGGARTPRICQVSPAASTGTCFGLAPRVGEPAIILTSTGASARARITAVEAHADSCQNVTDWKITIVGAEQLSDVGQATAYLDLPFDPSRTAMIDTGGLTSPGERAGEQVLNAIDRTADGRPDFEVVAYACDDHGDLATLRMDGYCVDYWTEERGAWSKLRHDFVKSCM
jgi:hypothetical protein